MLQRCRTTIAFSCFSEGTLPNNPFILKSSAWKHQGMSNYAVKSFKTSFNQSQKHAKSTVFHKE